MIEKSEDVSAGRIPLRATAVSWRAVAVALLLTVTFGVTVLARSRSEGGVSSTVPARRATTGRGAGSGPLSPPAALVPSAVASSATGPPGVAAAVPSGAPPSGPPGTVVVDVAGRVRRPGLVRLPSGSRVWDAVTAAGGVGSGARLDQLNLARPLTDGEQVRVPGPGDPLPVQQPPSAVPGVPVPGVSVGSGVASPGGGRVDLNRATQVDLDALPGVGPVLAGRILAWRDAHGRFSRVEELGEVTGIGDKLLARLIPLVLV
ncbi:MAG: competence protein ComEA [Actinomycetota bacterium]|nr:competence protein ComEA [Actinomycetota bacterium]